MIKSMTGMDKERAYRILGISRRDSETERKRKYRRLMMLYHPDSTGDDNNEMSQMINAAYEYLKMHPKDVGIDEDDEKWKAAINENAFCERTIFVDYSFLDDRIPIRRVTEGKYLWDPYLEDFQMLARSVAIAAADIVKEYGSAGGEIEIFHLLMQEFIDPIDCARKIGRIAKETRKTVVYEFSGAVGISDRRLLAGLKAKTEPMKLYGMERDHRIRICDINGVIYGDLSYDDDGFYYVVSPLIADSPTGVRTEIYSAILHTDRRDLNFAGKLDVKIEISIEKGVTTSQLTCNADRIKKFKQ